MRNIIIGITLIFLTTNLVSAQEWLTNFEDAKHIASKENKNIILVFSGSDWCAPCIKLEKQILDTQEFQRSVKDNYVLVKADFPRKKKNQLPEAVQTQNKKLAEMYNKSGGFPLVVVLDNTGKKFGETGYKKTTPNAYLSILNKMILHE
ncbi:thioredoxin family protein [Aquimarina mytili]|uniref:Thioredoxin family protein n=1 Tax=Aquimarina mytili TaxID=874423 RepID=A0A937D697_9FLAO|nr:thioredoxin family protein [Aquimarina mytili]MBL0684159.1 thioredoxin family protein [Aquimarina mytili]